MNRPLIRGISVRIEEPAERLVTLTMPESYARSLATYIYRHHNNLLCDDGSEEGTPTDIIAVMLAKACGIPLSESGLSLAEIPPDVTRSNGESEECKRHIEGYHPCPYCS